MVKFNSQLLEFHHMVEFSKDNTVFAAARENGNGHMRIFLVHHDTGSVYSHNGLNQAWEELSKLDRASILQGILSARDNNIPVYKINGNSGSLYLG